MAATTPAPSVTPQLAQAVAATTARITTLDPFSVASIDSYWLLGHVIEPLMRVNPATRELLPCLALSWKVDKKKQALIIKLRPNVLFHDGQTFSADDVKATFDAYFVPQFKAELWRPMWADIESARVVNTHTIEFKLKSLRYLAVENILTNLRVLPRQSLQPSAAEMLRQKLIGTGPFQVSQFDSKRLLSFSPFANWWGRKELKLEPNFMLNVRTVADTLAAEQTILKGEVDQYLVPSSDVMKLQHTKARLLQSPATLGEGIWIDLNMRQPLFKELKLRQALLQVWDRERIARTLFHGTWQVAVDVFSPKLSFYPKGSVLPLDREAASKSLAQLGWQDSDSDGVLDKTIGGIKTKLEFTLMVKSAAQERWASLFQQDAQKVGIQVKLKRLEDDAQWWQMLRRGQFEAVASDGGVSDAVHASTYHSKGAYNFFAGSNAKVDGLIDRLESEFDTQKRLTLNRELIKIVRADLLQLPGLYSGFTRLLHSQRLVVEMDFPLEAWRWRLQD